MKASCSDVLGVRRQGKESARTGDPPLLDGDRVEEDRRRSVQTPSGGSRRAVERFRGWKKGEMMSNDQRRPFLAPLCLPAVGGPQPGSRNPWSMLLTAASCTQQASRVALFGAAAISHGERERE